MLTQLKLEIENFPNDNTLFLGHFWKVLLAKTLGYVTILQNNVSTCLMTLNINMRFWISTYTCQFLNDQITKLKIVFSNFFIVILKFHFWENHSECQTRSWMSRMMCATYLVRNLNVGQRERERAKYGEWVFVYKLTPVRLYVLSVCALNLRTSVDEILCLCVKVGTYLYVATTKRTLGERVCIFACV